MIRSMIRKILSFIRSGILIIKQLPLAIKISNEQSYYPEKRRKSYLRRLWDNIIWCFVYKEANKFYNLYGFDICHSDMNGYIDYRNFMISRNIANNVNSVKSYSVFHSNDIEIILKNDFDYLLDSWLIKENDLKIPYSKFYRDIYNQIRHPDLYYTPLVKRGR